ncbi:MAG: flagellar basal body-associated FliL family protein [Candidatus Adiutrix sp.]|jgi:flagellar FliL protein|nr:flagellar basal body-associated FliL family protein [Candidatus Adiutrix sp.]
MAKKEKAPAPPEETNKSEARALEAPAAAPRANNKKLIIIALAAMLAGVAISFAAFKLFSPAPPPPAAPEEAASHEADGEKPIEAPHRSASSGEEAAPPSGGHGGGHDSGGEGEAPVATGPQNIEFKPFIANLSDGKKFLKLTMSVEAENQALADEINAKIPQFRDIILMLLSSLAYDDIATMDGKIRLRNQMLNRINTQLTSGKVKNIYFSEFVVQ